MKYIDVCDIKSIMQQQFGKVKIAMGQLNLYLDLVENIISLISY